jgi:hypothetical protein
VEYCGRLPLALRIAGVRLTVHPQWSLERFARRLADRARRLEELELEDLGVRAGILHSFHGLDEETLDAFHRLARRGRPWFTAAAVVPDLGVPESVSERLLEALADSWLLETASVDPGGLLHYRYQELALCLAHELAESGGAEQRPLVAVVAAAKPRREGGAGTPALAGRTGRSEAVGARRVAAHPGPAAAGQVSGSTSPS